MDRKESLDFQFWSTSITRFNASKRVNSWKHCVRWSLLASSIYLTVLSILIYADKIKDLHIEFSQFVLIFLSIFMLCLSLIVNLNQLEDKANRYHECGRKVRRLLNIIKNDNDQSAVDLLTEQYDTILDSYENHMSIDYYQFIYNNKNKLTEDQKKTKVPQWYLIYIWMPFARYFPQLLLYVITFVLPMILILKIVDF